MYNDREYIYLYSMLKFQVFVLQAHLSNVSSRIRRIIKIDILALGNKSEKNNPKY